MDKRTVFADKLVLPRALKVLDSGVLVGEPPNLWLMKDTDGDLKADTKELVSDSYGRAAASIEHNANSLFWGLDNVIYTSEHDWHLRRKGRQVRDHPDARARPVGRLDGRCRADFPQRERCAVVRGFRRGEVLRAQPEPGTDARALRSADLAGGLHHLADPPDPRRQSRLPRSVLPARRQLGDDSRASARRSSIAAIGCPRSSTATRSSPTPRPTSCTATRLWTMGTAG